MPQRRDFLDEVIDERTARNPDFPALVTAVERRRELFRRLAEQARLSPDHLDARSPDRANVPLATPWCGQLHVRSVRGETRGS